MTRVGSTITAVCAVLAALLIAPPARADGTAPTGWVDGYQSPTEGVFQLVVHGRTATDATTLGNATIALNGVPVASGALCDVSQPCSQGAVPLSFDTKGHSDGVYHLVVTVSDSAGDGTALDAPDFEIWNDRPQGSSTATLTVGSAVPPPAQGGQPGGGTGGAVQGASAGSCTKPKLSMVLSQRPLRIRRGVPVLIAGKRYRFRGRLTCVVRGKRHSAPKRTRIELRAIVRGRSLRAGHATVGSLGRIVVRIACRSARTLEFRFTAPDGKVTRVRIEVQTVKVKQRHKKG